MKERPILFSGPMVRAVLDGSKTQTRRLVKPQLSGDVAELFKVGTVTATGCPVFNMRDAAGGLVAGVPVRDGRKTELIAPYATGWHLWVREAWRAAGIFDGLPPREISHLCELLYEADGAVSTGRDQSMTMGKLRPSMFMPRWASRINLKTTGVRVERLQDISEADARAEGAEALHFEHCSAAERSLLDLPLMENEHPHRNGFALLWESLNGAGSWAANPWVWALDFKQV